jgi:hypothetical protein
MEHILALRTIFRRLSVGDDDDFDPDEFFASYRDVLEKTDPFIQAVLNAHLDVEAHLEDLLELLVFHSADLENAQLRYLQKVHLARSFVQLGRNRPEWRVMIELNGLRNRIVHRNYRETLTVELKKLRDSLQGWGTDTFKSIVKTCSSNDLVVNAALICTGYLSHLTDEVKALKGEAVSDD